MIYKNNQGNLASKQLKRFRDIFQRICLFREMPTPFLNHCLSIFMAHFGALGDSYAETTSVNSVCQADTPNPPFNDTNHLTASVTAKLCQYTSRTWDLKE